MMQQKYINISYEDADLMDAHGFDVAAPLLIEKAIDDGRITPWPLTEKIKPTDSTEK